MGRAGLLPGAVQRKRNLFQGGKAGTLRWRGITSWITVAILISILFGLLQLWSWQSREATVHVQRAPPVPKTAGNEGSVNTKPASANRYSSRAKDEWRQRWTYSAKTRKPGTISDLAREGALEDVARMRETANELIVFYGQNRQGTLASNFVRGLERMGLYHWIMVAPRLQDCKALSELHEQSACTYDSTFVSEHERPGATNKWKISLDRQTRALRWRIVASLAAMGYNVLFSDADIAFADDPYYYLKSPPFSHYNLLFHSEDAAGNLIKNLQCGFGYVQNAQPNGGAVRMLSEYPRRYARFVDTDPDQEGTPRWISEAAYSPIIFFYDQDHIQDSLLTWVSGIESWRETLFNFNAKRGRLQQAHKLRQEYEKHLRQIFPTSPAPGHGKELLVSEPAVFPQEWTERFGIQYSEDRVFQWARLYGRDVNTSEGIPAIVGYGRENGSNVWQAFSRGILVENVEQSLARAKRIRGGQEKEGSEETFALLPVWFCQHWRMARLGMYGSSPTHGVAFHATNAMDKVNVLKALGLYDYASEAALPGSALQRKLFVDNARQSIVAYHPDTPLCLHSQASAREAIIRTLTIAADLTGRVVSFPRVACGQDWLDSKTPPSRKQAYRMCRTGSCNQWRSAPVGYATIEDVQHHRRLLDRFPELGQLPGGLPEAKGSGANPSSSSSSGGAPPVYCVPFVPMLIPDGPQRQQWGTLCKASHFEAGSLGSKAMHFPELEEYRRLHADASPSLSTNVAWPDRLLTSPNAGNFGGQSTRCEETSGSALNVSESELAMELSRFSEQLVVYLPGPMFVHSVSAGTEARVARYCSYY